MAAGRRPQRLILKAAAAAFVALALSACAPTEPIGPAGFTPTSFAALPGWGADHPAAAMPALLASCRRLIAKSETQRRWATACRDAATIAPNDDAAMLAFLQRDFQPWRITQGGRAEGLVTGYYEPEIPASRTRVGPYQTPLFARPPDLVDGVPYHTRAEIERGALAHGNLEIAWLADPIDLFFLQIQGSGRLRLPDGQIMRVGFAGRNFRPYVAIGRVLVDHGAMELKDVSLPSIRAWLVAHPKQAGAVMDANPAYVFFRERTDLRADDGPVGALGAPLTANRSVAIDPDELPLGAPVWLVTTDPLDGSRVRRLMLAQDTGTGIKGALRFDIFYGWGAEAEARAGRAHQAAAAFILLPR